MTIEEILKEDQWTLESGKVSGGPYIIRYRSSVLSPRHTESYQRCLRILWPYGTKGSGQLPQDGDLARMDRFEDLLCAAVERDVHAILVAVVTFDGARQWVFYTKDTQEFGARLEKMPHGDSSYPIELDAFNDRGWAYLRDDVLRRVSSQA